MAKKKQVVGREEYSQVGRGCDVGRQVEVAPLAQNTGPELHAYDAEDEEYEEAEQQDVAEHGQRVEQQHDQDAHTYAKGSRH